MHLAKIRIEKATVYIKPPYSDLISKDLTNKTPRMPESYKAYANIDILFRGLGNSNVISSRENIYRCQIDIPNDYIVVEKYTQP